MKNLGLTYCTNVHALGTWQDWYDTLGYFGPALRAKLGWAGMPMGLWFPAALMRELDQRPETRREHIKDFLGEKNLSTFTFNAFPYGDFHEKVVKTKVYHPDWTKPARLEYTLACARLLAYLLPQGATGSISTLPLGWRIGWDDAQSRRAAEQLCAFARAAAELADKEGRIIRLALEPEPGCVLETTRQVLGFWDGHLRPAAKAQGLAEKDLAAFLGICYDTCHQAVQFEDAVEVLDSLAAHGVAVVKMQLSSALEFAPDAAFASQSLRREFVEEKFLHQTRVRTGEGIAAFDDLPEALALPLGRGLMTAGAEALWAHPWRVHFHVPIDAEDLFDARVATTRPDMLRAFRHALQKDLCGHFEVETYTWSVLPEAHRPKTREALAECLAREIRFAAAHIPAGALHA